MDFYFILGLDSLEALRSWYRPDLLLSRAVILCALRAPEVSGNEKRSAGHCGEVEGGSNDVTDEDRFHRAAAYLLDRYSEASPDIRRLHCPRVDMSSTRIRRMAAAGEDLSREVTPAVSSFIEAHGLYRN